MTVRAVEGKQPYTGGTAIEIDENKVISLRLRDENNLIIYDAGDNEIYVDLQLPDELTPTDAFPVGITTGRVIVDNGWDLQGTIICAKTTSGDNIKLLYADEGTLWIDNGTGTFKQIYFKGDVDSIVQAIYTYINQNANVKAFLIYGTEAQKKQKLGDAINYYVVSGKIPLLNMDSVTYTLINAARGDGEGGTDDVYTFSSAVNSDTGKYKEVKVNVNSTTPISTTVDSYTVTEHSAGGGGSGDVVVSTDTGNELSTGVALWFGTESDFSSISTPDTNTLYIQYKSDAPTPFVSSWDITTAVEDQSVDLLSGQSNVHIRNVQISSDGLHVLQTGVFGTVYESVLSTPYDITSVTATHTGNFLVNSYIGCAVYSDDGTHLYVCGDAGGSTSYVKEWDLSTPFDITTASNVRTSPGIPLASGNGIGGMRFYDNGTKVIGLYRSTIIFTATLSTAWDITTIGNFVEQTTSLQYGNYGEGFAISPDGKNCYMASEYESNSKQLITTTAYNFSSVTAQTRSNPGSGNTFGIDVTADGKYMYIAKQSGYLYRYSFAQAS